MVDTIEFSFKEALKVLGDYKNLELAAISLPCGKCVECRKSKRQDMAVRLTHEVECHEESCFITLTYAPDNLTYVNRYGEYCRSTELPECRDGWYESLFKKDLQNFMKRLRKHLKYVNKKVKTDRKDHVESQIRYFAVGEYGSKGQRPHWHVMIFGWKPSDLHVHKNCGNYIVYRSDQIEKLWKFGFSTVGDCNNAVARYCAQYVTKKLVKGHRPNEEFTEPEVILCSKMNGGIGYAFVQQFHKQIAEQGYVMVFNRKANKAYKCRIPAYYVRKIKELYPMEYQLIYDRQMTYLTDEMARNELRGEEFWTRYWKDQKARHAVWFENQKRLRRSFEEPEKPVF